MNQDLINNQVKRSKAGLIIFLAALGLLVVLGGYWVYKQKLTEKSESISTNQTEPSLQDNSQINQKVSIPEGWKEYELTGCGVSIQIPGDWQLNGDQHKDKTFSLLSPDWKEVIEETRASEVIFEGPFEDIKIHCYSSLKEFTKEGWELNKENNPNFRDPVDLLDSLTRKSNIGPSFSSTDELLPIMGILDAQVVQIGNKEGFTGFQFGTPGAVLTYYFENPKNRKIISFESEMTEYQEKRLKKPHSQIIENFQWLE